MAPNRRFSSICKTAGHDKLFVRNMNQVIRLRVILKKNTYEVCIQRFGGKQTSSS